MAGSFSTDGDWTGTRHPHDVHTSEPGCISEPQLGQNISTSSSVARRRKNPVLAWGVRYQFRNRQSTTGGHPHRFQSHFLHGATTRLVSDGRHESFDPERRGGLRSSLFEIRDRPATGPNQGRGTRTVRLRRGRFRRGRFRRVNRMCGSPKTFAVPLVPVATARNRTEPSSWVSRFGRVKCAICTKECAIVAIGSSRDPVRCQIAGRKVRTCPNAIPTRPTPNGLCASRAISRRSPRVLNVQLSIPFHCGRPDLVWIVCFCR